MVPAIFAEKRELIKSELTSLAAREDIDLIA
jgi:hypothetical protein